MNKKVKENKKTKVYKSTYDEYVESLSPKRKKEFDQGLKDFALSELILALKENDEISVRRLAKIAGLKYG